MSWTDDRVSLLTKLWGEGHTAAEIAKKLGGVTRNAVIGKAHRLKLSNRVSPIQQNKNPANTNTKKVKRKKITKKATSSTDVENISSTSKPVLKTAAKPVTASRAPRPETQPIPSSVAVKKGDLYTLLELKPRQCRWPSGDPKEDNFGFCGDGCMAGLPYCSDHAKLAYQAATRNRIFNTGKSGAKDKTGKAVSAPAKKVATS